MRTLNEQTEVLDQGSAECDINVMSQFDLNNYVEYQFYDLPWGEVTRSIGLFAIKIDETKFDVHLKDNYEYQVISKKKREREEMTIQLFCYSRMVNGLHSMRF